MKRSFLALLGVFIFCHSFSQQQNLVYASRWADSVLKTLSPDERIAQLMVVRVSSMDSRRQAVFFEQEVMEAIEKYNIGGLCLFQGGPLQQATMLNKFQAAAKTPLLVTIDAENGVGMRFDSVQGLPRQMMLGAVTDATILQQYGRVVGEQCRRIGIQVNYAPVVDVNNNPDNPVINDRSFGEDKYKVALFGLQYMRGMQDVGVMACAKHFPGHGDVNVDSHYDLPVIRKSLAQLDSLELYPFRQLVKGGVGSVMVAHLYIPAIDKTANRATSLSKNNVTGLLRDELGFKGITFTDALEMKGVSKFFGPGEASAQSLIAGNDMLCLPGDIPKSIQAIKQAIKQKKLTWKDLDARVKKVLEAKYLHGLGNFQPIDLHNLTEDLNRDVPEMRKLVAENAITLLRNTDAGIFPLKKGRRVAYVGVGLQKDNRFAERMREDYDAHTYFFDYTLDSGRVQPMLDLLRNRYDLVVIGLHAYSRFPANNFGISSAAWSLVHRLQQDHRSVTMVFGNPYTIKNTCDAKVLVACYEDDAVTHDAAADLLQGRFEAKGKLPVTVCSNFHYGAGIVSNKMMPAARPGDLGFESSKFSAIDSIVHDAIRKKAIPGAVVLVAKDGRVAYERAFGHMTFDSTEAVYNETIYDLASITKVMATTAAVMKLYDEGRLGLDNRLGDYLPWTRESNKGNLSIRDILLHQAGLVSWIPFYRETVDPANGNQPNYGIYSRRQTDDHTVRVAENLYMRNAWVDTMYARILNSPLGPKGKYVYSDNDFIFLGKIVESITGQRLDEYVEKTFYAPLRMRSTGFLPRVKFPVEIVAPTEQDLSFRQQLVRGDVHDPGAAMFGGVAGHAGLFSNASDLARLAQVLLNGGEINGMRFFKKETVDLFTAYQNESRRGLGFDKPEKDNATRKDPYPSASAPPETFGHTGFTGTCIWLDPTENLMYIFLSNRVNAPDPSLFLKMSIRPKVHEVIYDALKAGKAGKTMLSSNPGTPAP